MVNNAHTQKSYHCFFPINSVPFFQPMAGNPDSLCLSLYPKVQKSLVLQTQTWKAL